MQPEWPFIGHGAGTGRTTNSNDGYVIEMPAVAARWPSYYEEKRNTKRRINGLTMRDARARTIYQNDTVTFR